MSNKIKYGLKNVYYAIQTCNTGVYSYGTPVRIPGAVNLSLNAQEDVSPFYADDVVYYRTQSNNGYEGSLELALIPDHFRTSVLGDAIDPNGVIYESSENIEPVYFALLFEFAGDEKAVRHVMYNCTATRPSVESQTKESSVSPSTESLSLTCDPREDGLIKCRTGENTGTAIYNAWYDSVYVPASSGTSAQLAALTIGSLTLTPAFSPSITTYTATTGNSTDNLTATAAAGSGVSVSITVNGTAHTSGNAASWETGTNTVVIVATKTGLTSTAYSVTVTKA